MKGISSNIDGKRDMVSPPRLHWILDDTHREGHDESKII